jgi:hypothetical protein
MVRECEWKRSSGDNKIEEYTGSIQSPRSAQFPKRIPNERGNSSQPRYVATQITLRHAIGSASAWARKNLRLRYAAGTLNTWRIVQTAA